MWLHEGAAGLRFRYALNNAPASTDTSSGDSAASGAAASAALASSVLGYDPRARAGLTNAETLAALGVAAADLADSSLPRSGFLRRARAALLARGVPDRARRTPLLRPVLTAAPRAAIVRALGSAEAWRDTPAGRGAVRWSAAPGGGFSLSLELPAGVAGRVALPLALLRDAAGSSGVALVRVAAPTAAASTTTALVLGDALPPQQLACAPAIVIEGVRVRVCGAALRGGAASPRIASAADADGDARLHGGLPLWETGALLWEQLAGEGEWIFRVGTDIA